MSWPVTASSHPRLTLTRQGYRIIRVELDGLDLTGTVRRVEIIEDASTGPMVRVELMAQGYIEEIEPEPTHVKGPPGPDIIDWPELPAVESQDVQLDDLRESRS